MKEYNVLIVDDHQVTCKGYSYFFENAYNKGSLPRFHITIANDSEEAYKKIKNCRSSNLNYHIILLDIRLPSYPSEQIFSGEDLGEFIRKTNPQSKIIVQTSLSDNHILYNVFKNLNPEGIILKSDLDEDSFVLCIREILNDNPYYTTTFSKLIRNQFSKNYNIDNEDRELLYLFNKGILSKEIPKHLHWSLSKVEKRTRQLRRKFGVEDNNIPCLLNAAKLAGFL